MIDRALTIKFITAISSRNLEGITDLIKQYKELADIPIQFKKNKFTSPLHYATSKNG